MKILRPAMLAGLLASLSCGCGGDGESDGGAGSAAAEVLTGSWEVSQVNMNGTTTPVSDLHTTGSLTLNTNGTFVLDARGLITARYTGTYTATGGRFTMSVNETGRTVSGAYELSSGLLELTMTEPVTILTVTIDAVALVRD